MLGSVIQTIPFSLANNYYTLTISNLSLTNVPLSIESFPLSSNKIDLSVFCGDENQYNVDGILLTSEIFLDAFSLCDTVEIKLSPKYPRIGMWLRINSPIQIGFVSLLRLIFFIIVAYSFYIIFRSEKANYEMRSIMITQTSTLLILSPFKLLNSFFPGIFGLHLLFSCIGWWRCAEEVFTEYGPLVRRSGFFYRILSQIPAFILFITTISESLSKFYFPFYMKAFGFIGGFILPLTSTYFLHETKRVNGRMALTIHVTSATLSLTVAYYSKLLKILSDSFREACICETAEITFIGCYAMFQTIFQAGQKREQKGLAQYGLRRNESIDGMLDKMDFGEKQDFVAIAS